MYHVKAFLRFCRFHLHFGIYYQAYANPTAIGYAGWYSTDTQTIAFKHLNGRNQYKWRSS